MTNRSIEASPQLYARTGGALYLAIILLGGFAEGFVLNRLAVSGDAVATAHNIMASAALWRLGVAGDFIVVILAIPLMWIEYLLLRPAGKNLVVLVVFLNLTSLAVESVSKLFLLAIMPMLTNSHYLSAFEPRQLQGLAGLTLASHNIAFDIALIFLALRAW